MINAAIVGIGRWGQRLVSSVQGTSDAIRFTAGATGRRARAEDFCRAQGIDLRDGLDDLLADPTLDAVVLATPHTQHRAQVEAAAAAGKHVFVEKPFTLTRADAQAAADAARAAGVVCALGHNRRFLPAMARLKEMIDGGELGRVLHAEGHFSSSGAMDYTADHWRASHTESPAGGMTGMGIHVVDAFIHLLGPIAEVTAQSQRRALAVDMDDTTAMLLRFAAGPTGYLGTLAATALMWRVRVFGSAGWAEMHDTERLVTRRTGAGGEETREFPVTDSVRAELEAFAAAAAGGPPYPLPLDQAVHGAAVLEAVVESSRAGTPVAVPGID
ncbi:MAG: Gfo/Idh/MocA family oxidoreductase [Hyphomicrobiales bacterium]|nr:Gfo/Idh/MocA family oxidoreductase [Hyphomicrobiales bacterium]